MSQVQPNPATAKPAPQRYVRGRWLISGYTIAVVIVACVLFAVYVYRSPRIDPDFSIQALRGLTPGEVTARFGPADVDPRIPKFGSWTPADEVKFGDKLCLSYYDPRFLGRLASRSYGVTFVAGHVDSVAVGEK